MFLPLLAQETTPKRSRKEEKRARDQCHIKQEEEGVITYRKHSAFGVKLITDGYGVFFEIGRAQICKKGNLVSAGNNRTQAPERRKATSNFSTTAPIIYGKINFFYPVKLGVQKQFLTG